MMKIMLKEDFDMKFLVCDVYEKITKLDVNPNVIFDEDIIKDIPRICLRIILKLMKSKLMLLYFK